MKRLLYTFKITTQCNFNNKFNKMNKWIPNNNYNNNNNDNDLCIIEFKFKIFCQIVTLFLSSLFYVKPLLLKQLMVIPFFRYIINPEVYVTYNNYILQHFKVLPK